MEFTLPVALNGHICSGVEKIAAAVSLNKALVLLPVQAMKGDFYGR